MDTLIQQGQIQSNSSRSGQLISLAAGALSGVFLVCAVTPVRLLLGTNREVDTAMVLTAAVCCWWVQAFRIAKNPQSRRLSWCLPAAGVWVILLPGLLTALLKLISNVPLNQMEVPVLAYGTIFLICLMCLGPIWIALRLSHVRSGTHGKNHQWLWMFGLGAACLLLPTLILPISGTTILSWFGLILSGLWQIGERRVPTTSATGDAVNAPRPATPTWIPGAVAILTGATLALTAFIAGQLIPRNLTGDLALLAGLVIGMGCAVARHSWKVTAAIVFSTSIVCLSLAAWTGLVVAGYPLWTLFCLQINAWVDNVALLFALRMGFLMLLALPAGFLIRRLASRRSSDSASPLMPLLIAVGFIIAPWLPCSPRIAATGLIGLALLLTALSWATENFRMPQRMWQKMGTAALATVAVIGLIFSGNLQPERSERILFSSVTLQSVRSGIPVAEVRWMDEGRPLAAFSSLSDHIGLWKYHGSQVVVRRDGLPVALHSARPEICPHSAGELLPVMLPLVMHPDPEQVMVQGIHPPTLLTCHLWPLQTVQTFDNAETAHEMLEWMASHPDGGLSLENGPEFRFSRLNPLLSLNVHHPQRYDLIICPIVHPSLGSAASLMSQEYYRCVRRHLNSGGIFSQRIPYYDLGPEVIREMASTLKSVFGEVRAVESIPGELVFLCSEEQLPAIDESLVERLKSPQCRRLLAQCGWDWSLLLGRGGLEDHSLAEFGGSRSWLRNARSDRLAFSLPFEVSRWGAKADQTRQALAQHGKALRTELGESAASKEVTQRLEDLNLAHQIQKDHPNDPWAYRAALKSRLQDRPRTTIMQVNHELKRVLDPEDQRRKDYLVALGKSARQPVPDPVEVQQLTEFQFPFDPLVSMFVHHETSHLIARCEPALPELRLNHLLHTIYYASPYDQSVRNVTDALKLLCSQENTWSSEAQRWDEVNSLLQTLMQRWQLRLSTGERSRYELVDTEESVSAAEEGLRFLDRHYSAVGLNASDWKLRKNRLQESLLRPLNRHRSERVREAPIVAPSKTEQG